MVDAVSAISNSFLSLSAQDLRELTDWPDPLIEDYLAILRNLLSIATIVDEDIEGQISANMGLIQIALGKLTGVQKQIADLEGTASANSALIFQAIGKLTGLNKGLSDIDARESADYSASLVTTYSIFGAPPAIGNIRISPGYFSQGAVGTNTLRDDIDSTTPNWQIEGVGAVGSLSVVRNSNDAAGALIYLGKTRATVVGGSTVVQDNDVLGGFVFVAADGTDLDTKGAGIIARVDDSSPSAGAIGTELLLLVTDTSGVELIGYQISSSLGHNIPIGDNLVSAWSVVQGTDQYLTVVTTNGSEVINFGNTTTNPDFTFLGSGTLNLTGDYSSTNGNITLTNGTITGAFIVDNSTVLITSGATLGDGAGAGAGTLTNAPSAGDPSKWVPINDNGTTRYVPAWT